MELQKRLDQATKHFWKSEVRAGKRMDEYIGLVRDLLFEAGCAREHVHTQKRLEIPGYFRREKRWDLIIVRDGTLLAAVEFKAQIKAYGKNVNNRAEEAIGNAVDLRQAYDHGLLHKGLPRPWFGYFFLLRDCAEVKRLQRAPSLRHFHADQTFTNASYQRRYELLCERLVASDLYQSACFLMSDESTSKLVEPNPQLTFAGFAEAACGYIKSITKKPA